MQLGNEVKMDDNYGNGWQRQEYGSQINQNDGSYNGMRNNGMQNNGIQNYGVPVYGQPYPGYDESGQFVKEKGNSTAFGITSFILGVVSLLLFCTCINWLTGLLAIIFGIIQIIQNRQKGLAIGGIVTAGISMLFSMILYVIIFFGLLAQDSYNRSYYNGYYDNYYNQYDDYESYYDEFYNFL